MVSREPFRVWIIEVAYGHHMVRQLELHQDRQRYSSTSTHQTHQDTHELHQKSHS
jgi:hypothetical protein